MSEHTHSWQPIPGECAKYACSECPATGYRSRAGIVEHKTKPAIQRQWTARNHKTDGSGRVGRSPLEDWQKWGGEE